MIHLAVVVRHPFHKIAHVDVMQVFFVAHDGDFTAGNHRETTDFVRKIAGATYVCNPVIGLRDGNSRTSSNKTITILIQR